MKELTTKTTQIIQTSLHVAEQVLSGGEVPPLHITSSEVRDVVDDIDRIKTASTADAVDSVIEMVLSSESVCLMVRKGWLAPESVPSGMYDYSLDEYQAAVQRLGIPVGGENQ